MEFQPGLVLLAIVVGLGILVALVIIMTHNGIIENANRIRRAWADVLVHERQKTNILDELKVHVKGYADYEAPLLEKITRLRSRIDDLKPSPDHAGLSSVQTGTQELLSGLRVAVEAYPNLQAATVVSKLLREITEQEENVGAAIKIYNAAVEFFNNSIQTFFGSWVNRKFTKKEQADSFTDAKAASGIGFVPKLP